MPTSEHLPECTSGTAHGNLTAYCICDRLYAAEQRQQQTLDLTAFKRADYARGYTVALERARDAVAALTTYWDGANVNRIAALEAIDALTSTETRK